MFKTSIQGSTEEVKYLQTGIWPWSASELDIPESVFDSPCGVIDICVGVLDILDVFIVDSNGVLNVSDG